jgi:hypothetical protein
MTFERLRAFDTAAGADLETLGRAAFGFHLRHDCSLSYGARCFPMEKLETHTPLFIGTACCFIEPTVPLPSARPNLFLLGFR